MSTVQKQELHDGGYPPPSSHPQSVEVVEMRDVHKSGDDEISRGFVFRTEGKPKTQLRAQYDQGERQRKVSKYQSKKKIQPKTPSVFTKDIDLKIKREELTAEKPLALAELRTENDLPDTSESSFDAGVHTVSVTAVECGTEGVQSDYQYSSDARCSGADPFDLDNQTEEELLYGDGEDCSDLDMMEDEYSDYLFAENCQEMNTQSLKDDYEDISDISASEDSGSSEDEANAKIKKSVRSPMKGSAKITKPGSQMPEGDREGKQTSQKSTSDRITKVSSTRMPLAESGAKSPVQSKSTSPSKASVGVKTVDKCATVAHSSPQKLTAHAKNTSPNNTSQTSTVSKTPVSSLQAKSKNSVISPMQGPCSYAAVDSTSKVSEPVVSASGLSAIKRTFTVAISSKSDTDSTETNQRSFDYLPKKFSKSADTFPLGGSSKTSITVASSKTDSSFSSESKYNHSSSSLLSQMDSPLMEREILPGIQSSGHLGLSSHTGADWNMEEMEEVSADEDDEDSDVLSLYDYDTFLEEEEQEQRDHGTVLSMRSVSKDGESGLHLSPEENLSISISDKSERRVSRPNSKERNENESQTAVRNDSKEKSETAGEGKDKETQPSVPKPQVRQTQSTKPEGVRERQGVNDDHKFQKPNLPSPKIVKQVNQASSKPFARPVKTAGLFAKPANMPQRGLAEGRNDKYRQPFQARGGLGGRRQMGRREPQKTQAIPSFQRIPQHRLEEMKKELEAELKYFVEKKSIFEATETVGKIHRQESMNFMKIERVLVLNLLHLLIREGAVPQLMRIFTFVCNQGLFNPEVCNAYIRLGCAEGNKYDRQLKNIFQYLRRHSIQPAGDCIISLLSLYSEHTGDPAMFWFMLSYFDTFPGFVVPMPLLERAIRSLLQHKDRGALSKFNQWVLTTKTESVLQKLNLALIGRMAASMLPASRSRVQQIIASAQGNEGDELKKDFSSPVDTTLVIPSNFTDQDYHFYSRRIQDCGTHEDMDRLAEIYVELCSRSAGYNRCLLKDYTQALLQKNVVGGVDKFLHALYNAVQQERSQGSPVDADELALAHLSALVVEHVCFNHHADVTLGLLKVITQCPLVVKKLLMNCGDVGYKTMAVCLQCQQPLQALDLLKALRLRKNDEQGATLMKDLLRQLVAVRDIPSAVTALKVAAVQEAMDIGLLAAQLMWHSLNVGDVKVALELQDLAQKHPSSSPAPQLPAALLRALLVACSQSGYSSKAVALFKELKRRRVYNAEAFGARPYVFQVSTMLTPTEIQCCVLDRLKELHLKLCNQMKQGGRLGPMDKGLAVKLVREHDPQLLSLPFLALAPRSLEQAVAVVAQELAARISPPLQAAFDQQIQLLVLEPGSLVAHLQSYPTPGLKQGLVWQDDDPPQSSPSAVRRPPSVPPLHPASSAGRQFSPPPPQSPSRLQGSSTGRQLPVSQAAGRPKPLVPGSMQEPVPQSTSLPFPKRGGPDERHLPARAPLLPLPEPQDPGEGQFPVSQMAGNPFPKPADSGRGQYIPEPLHDAHLQPRLEESGRREAPEPWNVVQPSFQQVDSARMHLPELSDMSRHPHQLKDGRQVPMSVDVVQPSYQPKDFTRRQFPEQRNVTRPIYQPAVVVQNQAPMSGDAPPPLVQPGKRLGRQMSIPPPSRPQSSQQPRQQMKRRSSVPPKQQPAAQSQPFKVPLLPTPKFHPDKRPGMPDVELSEELPPKKMKMSLPDRPFAGGRRPAPEIQQTLQQQQQQPQSSPALQIPQSSMPGDIGRMQQLSSNRGMPLPSDRYRDERRSPELFSQIPGGQSTRSSRDPLPQSTQRMRQPTPQNWQGISQPLQQFPPEDMGHLPSRSSQSNRQFTQQTSEGFGQQYHEKQEPLSKFNPRGGQTTKEPGHLPQRSIHQNSWRASQNTLSVSQSRQQFTGDGDKLPVFPPRFDEQRWNSSAQMGAKDEVMIQEMGPEDTDHWQDRPRFGQQPQGAQPWGDAPWYDEGEDLSWHSQFPVHAHSFVPTDQAAERFSCSETAPDPFRHQDRFHKPVYQMRGLARGRGRPPYRGRKL